MLHNVGDEDMRSTDHEAKQQRLGDGPTRRETEELNGASAGAISGVEQKGTAANDKLMTMLIEFAAKLKQNERIHGKLQNSHED